MELQFVRYLYSKSHRILSPCLIPFCLPFAPDQLSEEFYFIFPPSINLGFTPYSYQFVYPILSKLVSLLQTSHIHFSLLYNILIPVPPLLNFIKLSLISTLLWFICNFASIGPVPFQFYLKPHSILLPFLTLLFSSPFHVLLML